MNWDLVHLHVLELLHPSVRHNECHRQSFIHIHNENNTLAFINILNRVRFRRNMRSSTHCLNHTLDFGLFYGLTLKTCQFCLRTDHICLFLVAVGKTAQRSILPPTAWHLHTHLSPVFTCSSSQYSLQNFFLFLFFAFMTSLSIYQKSLIY